MRVELRPFVTSENHLIVVDGHIVGDIDSRFAHLITGVTVMDSLTAAQRFARAALEQSDDAAHVTGKIDAEMRRLKALTEAERVDELVEKCRELVTLHRDVARFYLEQLQWFARHPDAKARQTIDGDVITPAFARSEYRLARQLHMRICPQAHHWLREQAKHRAAVVAGPITLPPAANDTNPSSRESAA